MTATTDLRALLAAATPGPWFGSAGGRYVYGATPGDEVAQCARRSDADLVRTAVNTLPDLLDKADAHDRLVAAVERLRATMPHALDCGLPCNCWKRWLYDALTAAHPDPADDMTATAEEHECVFVEEREPSGRLILPPCIVCGFTAMDALDQLRRERDDAHVTIRALVGEAP